jgi:uncharacterized protein
MRTLLLTLSILILPQLFVRPALALDVPHLEARVTDMAGVLTREQIAALEARLAELERTDSTQLAVLIIPSLQGEVLEDFSERVATQWKLGQRGRDNGALLLISMKERRIRIEVGYGLEPTLTDALSRRIIQNEIGPLFREGQFYAGIDAGLTAMIQAVRGNYQATPSRGAGRGRRSFNWLIVLLFPLFWILSAVGRWGGGLLGFGAGMLLVHSLLGPQLLLMLFGGILGGAIGMVLGSLVRAANVRQGSPPWTGFGGPFYHGRGGGGSWGGGFSGGGFSGGGGSFGGGGSSGSW